MGLSKNISAMLYTSKSGSVWRLRKREFFTSSTNRTPHVHARIPLLYHAPALKPFTSYRHQPLCVDQGPSCIDHYDALC